MISMYSHFFRSIFLHAYLLNTNFNFLTDIHKYTLINTKHTFTKIDKKVSPRHHIYRQKHHNTTNTVFILKINFENWGKFISY